MAEIGVIASVIGVAGAGFRLSLVLNAVGVEIATADLEIHKIAKEISLFSLMLKQVGLTMEATESIASLGALDTAREITSQSQTVFNEVKDMVEMSQKRDSNGHLRSITIAQRVRWCFKKQKVQYLLGQLESLKLSLSIMLQVLQLGKVVAASRRDPSKALSNERDLQERAEIQNMVVVRHSSLVDLRRLYQLAEEEVVQAVESPPVSYETRPHTNGDPRLSIQASQHEMEDTSQTMVKYHELPLSQLDSSMNKAMYKPNRIMHAPDVNVVDHLLDEWTRVREIDPRFRHRSHKYRSRYETDDEDDSAPEFERSADIGGHYIEGPPNSARNVKNVRFRARVESDSEDSDKRKPNRRAPRKHILRSEEDSSSLSSSSSDLAPLPNSRRSSGSSTAGRGSTGPEPSSNSRRYTPSPAQSGAAEAQSGRPNSRGGPPSPLQPRPMPFPQQSWQGQFAGPAFRPIQPQNMSPGLQRPAPAVPYGFSPPAGYGPPNPQRLPSYPPPPHEATTSNPSHHNSQRSRHRPKEKKRESKGSSFREHAKKDVTRGLLGAGAVAGLMDILDGLSAI